MITIRLSRIGKKKKPMYRLIISEQARDPYGQALEILGSYNPFTKELEVKKERIDHWLEQGAQMSPTVNNLLIEKKIIDRKKVKASTMRKKKKVKEETKGTDDKKAETPAEEKKPEEKKEDKNKDSDKTNDTAEKKDS